MKSQGFIRNMIMMSSYCLMCAVLSLLIFRSYADFQKRVKRVIDGLPFNGRPLSYSAIRYYGALGTVHGRSWWTLGIGKKGVVTCSGALLAPMIFQTACHCVTLYDLNSDKFIRPPIVKNSWESISVVYFGVSNRFGKESMETYSYVLTEKFMVHKQCGQIQGGVATYDYAVIRLNADWVKADRRTPYPWEEIRWAPHYTDQQISYFHDYALRNQLVCLQIGFGDYKPSEDSEVLRHGWATLLPPNTCILKTAKVEWWLQSRQKVSEYANWVCTEKFPLHDQRPAPGDSGGPLTCNNRYFAIVSGATEWTKLGSGKIELVPMHHPLVHDLLVSACNYRVDLIHKLYLIP